MSKTAWIHIYVRLVLMIGADHIRTGPGMRIAINRKIYKKHVEKKAALHRLLQSERKVKLKFLIHLCNVYSYLLYCLFNEV